MIINYHVNKKSLIVMYYKCEYFLWWHQVSFQQWLIHLIQSNYVYRSILCESDIPIISTFNGEEMRSSYNIGLVKWGVSRSIASQNMGGKFQVLSSVTVLPTSQQVHLPELTSSFTNFTTCCNLIVLQIKLNLNDSLHSVIQICELFQEVGTKMQWYTTF